MTEGQVIVVEIRFKLCVLRHSDDIVLIGKILVYAIRLGIYHFDVKPV